MDTEGGVAEEKGSSSPRVSAQVSSVVQKNVGIRVYPPALDFVGVEFGPLYVMTVSVQNTDSKVRRIRIKPPTSKFFRLAYFPNTAVAPGLDAEFEVEFQALVEQDYHDSLVVYSGDDEIEIPLHAYTPAPNIEFETFCDLGVVVLGNKISKFVEFTNFGHRQGEISIECDDTNFIISPTKFVIGPKGHFIDQDKDGRMEEDEWVDFPRDQWSQKIRVEIVGQDIGPLRALAQIKVKGVDGSRVLDMNAEIVDQRLELVPTGGGGGKAVTSIPFGIMYFGESRVCFI